MTQPEIAHPPETVEGWYALHQLYSPAATPPSAEERDQAIAALDELACPPGGGWTAVAQVIGSRADLLVMHFRPTLDDLGVAQRRLEREPYFASRPLAYSFLSITEAGLYHITAQLAKAAAERGGAVGDDAYRAALAERVRAGAPASGARGAWEQGGAGAVRRGGVSVGLAPARACSLLRTAVGMGHGANMPAGSGTPNGRPQRSAAQTAVHGANSER